MSGPWLPWNRPGEAVEADPAPASGAGLRVIRWLKGRGAAAADGLWPPVCAHCEAGTERSHALCPACWGRLAFIERPYCERLGTPFAVDLGGKLLSPAAIARPPAFERARAVTRYDDIARKLVQRLKYGDRLELAQTMGRLMRRAGGELIADADVIVPVPLHLFRFWRRQYNQATLLARVIAELSGLPLEPDLIDRRKATRPQVGLTRAERAANVTGAFRTPAAVRPRIEGRRILLVDDVLTTGATVNAAANVLLRARAKAVDVLTFARVVADGA